MQKHKRLDKQLKTVENRWDKLLLAAHKAMLRNEIEDAKILAQTALDLNPPLFAAIELMKIANGSDFKHSA